mmetsp:Transcript_33997/g.87323  ORF Transcript_33997/g.87323 Transcript_33997/m.87323 type:complete len:286 (-) Transcript_33997:247-1104(-)
MAPEILWSRYGLFHTCGRPTPEGEAEKHRIRQLTRHATRNGSSRTFAPTFPDGCVRCRFITHRRLSGVRRSLRVPYSFKCDIWSIGILMYEFLFGALVFPAVRSLSCAKDKAFLSVSYVCCLGKGKKRKQKGETTIAGWVRFCILCDLIGQVCLIHAGFTPFRGKGKEETYRNILSEKYWFPDSEEGRNMLFRNHRCSSYQAQRASIQTVSNDAKQMLCQLLSVDPKSRPTALEALGHPWFQRPCSCLYFKQKVEELLLHFQRHARGLDPSCVEVCKTLLKQGVR